MKIKKNKSTYKLPAGIYEVRSVMAYELSNEKYPTSLYHVGSRVDWNEKRKGFPHFFKIRGDFISLYPIPDRNLEIEVQYTELKKV